MAGYNVLRSGLILAAIGTPLRGMTCALRVDGDGHEVTGRITNDQKVSIIHQVSVWPGIKAYWYDLMQLDHIGRNANRQTRLPLMT